ncbi:MAG: site-specific integrase, partial [Actinomycetota bacterium]|nr:site-specific integrase [Actinomycetota bacterium]
STWPASLVVFDLLAASHDDLTASPWQQRNDTARLLAERFDGQRLCLAPTTEDGAALWKATREMGLEGVVAYPNSRGGHRLRRQTKRQRTIRVFWPRSPYGGPPCRSSSWTLAGAARPCDDTRVAAWPSAGEKAVRLGFAHRRPFLLDDDGGYDQRLNSFFRARPTLGVRSAVSQKAYAYDLLAFARFLSAVGRTVWEADRHDIDRYFDHRCGEWAPEPLSLRSWNRAVTVGARRRPRRRGALPPQDAVDDDERRRRSPSGGGPGRHVEGRASIPGLDVEVEQQPQRRGHCVDPSRSPVR